MSPTPTAPDLPWLAIETSGSLGSVAVGAGGRVRAESRLETPGNHATELVPRIAAALAEAGVARSALAGIVVGGGPGSFTGVRIAAATGKGMAHALGVPLAAFSSLEAAAVADESEHPVRGVLFDARGDRVYAACYRWSADGLATLAAPHATRVGALLDTLPAAAVLMGTGATRHEALLREAGHAVLPPPAGIPSARALLRLLAGAPAGAGTVPLDRWEPEYVKESSATPPGRG